MFTGIVSDIGRIARIDARGDTRVVVETAYDMATVDLGASIACSGVCLTVVDKGVAGQGVAGQGGGWFAVDVSGETISRTAAMWVEGERLNLERAMKLGDELGGHIVTGHVDGVGEVVDVVADGDSRRIDIRVAPELAPFLAPKGSITVDGVSLTVNTVVDAEDGTRFGINLIPHTQAVTTLGDMTRGAFANIEIDVLARYLQRMEHYRAKA